MNWMRQLTQNVRLMGKTLKRDVNASITIARMQRDLRRFKRDNLTLTKLFERVTAAQPDKICLLTHHGSYTFRDVDQHCNRVANFFEKRGLQKNDEVAIIMESTPKHIGVWLGFCKLGVVCALINTSLRSVPLAHCVTAVNAKLLIFSLEYIEIIREASDIIRERNPNVQYFCIDAKQEDLGGLNATALDPLLEECSPSYKAKDGSFHDTLMYLYTSGTTGLPKAARFTNDRYLGFGAGSRSSFPTFDDDVIYLYLPIYHATGLCIGLSQVLMYGVTGALVPKFSATEFWDDCVRFGCTATTYVGEVCRYLLAQPPRDVDRKHKMRVMYGNGLRPQIWKKFQDRFGIRDIREGYGSTEGNCTLCNLDNKFGAVGFIPTLSRLFPRLTQRFFPVVLIRLDPITGEPLRDANGLCIPCKPGEVGEICGMIMSNTVFRYDGYTDPQATNKKIYRNVRLHGDAAFSSGDLLVMDELGYVYFRDRTGDTYRWKGENVSTAEVEGILSNVANLSDVVVFGVSIPGFEGKAGMAVILNKQICLDTFLEKAKKILPLYALPVFVRLTDQLDKTGSFKFKKNVFQEEGYDVDRISDPVYMLDLKAGKYVSVNGVTMDKINSGEMASLNGN